MAKPEEDNPVDTDDIALMLSVKAGDSNAFRSLIDRYKGRIVNFIAHVTGHPESAEDIAQEVFLQIFRARTRYVLKSKFSTYIYSIARNASYSFLRRFRNSPVSADVSDFSGIRDSRPGPEEQVDKALVEEDVRQALKSLSLNQRTAVILQYYDGLDLMEIARTMGTSVPAVKSLLFRARMELSRILRKKY